jgi:CheY-like chemotaxis protein
LRTPLNAVMGYAQILERDPEVPENRRGSVQVIRRSAEHLSGLIDGLLDISKIEAGRLHVYSNEINIQDFLDQIVDMFRLQAAAKGLEFRHSRAKALPVYVRTDEKRLRQILVNLLSNAIKFTSSGHVSFEVGYRMQVATFTVSDSGSGICAGDLDHIFEPFVRGEAEHNRFTPGLGLGLTITKLLTETLGGEITVSSTVGVGTRFQARLMLAKVERTSRRLVGLRRIIGYAGPTRVIMVVDDNQDHRELMREMLSPLGFVVLTAGDGLACLEEVSLTRPDMFFIDIRMPGMSGWDLVATLRERGFADPIVMLSANIGDGAGPASRDAGHNAALAKPFELTQLLDKIGAQLGLDWIYDEAQGGRPETAWVLRSPGVEHLRDLANLGQIGHVRGIEAKLTELAVDPDNEPLVAALRGHMKNFDFDSYAELLERVGHESN